MRATHTPHSATPLLGIWTDQSKTCSYHIDILEIWKRFYFSAQLILLFLSLVFQQVLSITATSIRVLLGLQRRYSNGFSSSLQLLLSTYFAIPLPPPSTTNFRSRRFLFLYIFINSVLFHHSGQYRHFFRKTFVASYQPGLKTTALCQTRPGLWSNHFSLSFW